MSHTVGVYAGSFDLFTKGHLWVAEQGSKLFDKLVIAVAINPTKKKTAMFSIDERMEQIRACTAHLPNVEVAFCGTKYLHDFVMNIDAHWVLRGVRGLNDYQVEAEAQDMVRRIFNARKITYDIQTAFVRPPDELASVSSSAVKGAMGYDNWEELVAEFVSPQILDRVIVKFKEVLHANV